jgi:hypothetical protein
MPIDARKGAPGAWPPIFLSGSMRMASSSLPVGFSAKRVTKPLASQCSRPNIEACSAETGQTEIVRSAWLSSWRLMKAP